MPPKIGRKNTYTSPFKEIPSKKIAFKSKNALLMPRDDSGYNRDK